jgi:hypothetical protein
MNRSIVLVAICLSAGCASTPNAETDELASDILLGNSQQSACGSGEVAYCEVSRAPRFPGKNADGACGCVPARVFIANGRTDATGTRIR